MLKAYERADLPSALATPSIIALVREHGRQSVEEQVFAAITAADGLLGGGMSAPQLVALTRMFLDDFGGRPVGSILMAIRNGVRQATVGHKLTYPILCEWMRAQDAAVEEHNYTQHLLNR